MNDVSQKKNNQRRVTAKQLLLRWKINQPRAIVFSSSYLESEATFLCTALCKSLSASKSSSVPPSPTPLFNNRRVVPTCEHDKDADPHKVFLSWSDERRSKRFMTRPGIATGKKEKKSFRWQMLRDEWASCFELYLVMRNSFFYPMPKQNFAYCPKKVKKHLKSAHGWWHQWLWKKMANFLCKFGHGGFVHPVMIDTRWLNFVWIDETGANFSKLFQEPPK